MDRSLRILCADDNSMLGDVMMLLFAKAGYWVEHVEDGLSAWERISQDLGNFDVVITDHEMPKLKGLELVELLHQAHFPGRIVVHTSSLTSAETASYRRFGVETIVLKACRAEDLLEAVEGAAR